VCFSISLQHSLGVPAGVVGSVSLPFYKALTTFKCDNPACMVAMLAFSPAGAAGAPKVMNYFMRIYCKPGAPHTNSASCVAYRSVRDYVKGLIKSTLSTNQLVQYMRSGQLGRLANNALNAARDSAVQFINEIKHSPELQPIVYADIPTSRGTYIKLRDCTPFAGVGDPYFKCYSISNNQRVGKTSQIGLRKDEYRSQNYFWARGSDFSRAGFGMFFPNAHGCVYCDLWNRQVLWTDAQVGYGFRMCAGSVDNYTPVPVTSASGVRGVCNLLYKDNR
jgi:hypothetical protein